MTFSTMSSKSKRIYRAGAIVIALVIWQAAAMILDQKLLLASPVQVVIRLTSIWREKSFWSSIWFSLERILAGFLIAFGLGMVLAFLAERFRVIEVLLWPYVLSIKAIPVASFIIISLIWLSAKSLSVFISFLMVFPVIYSNVLEGLKNTDSKILEMSKLYQLSFFKKFLYIQLPQIKPFLLSACNVAIGMSWKSGIAAEVIGIPTGSIGEMLYNAKIYFNTVDLLCWTVIIVIVSQLFEKAFIKVLEVIYRKIETL